MLVAVKRTRVLRYINFRGILRGIELRERVSFLRPVSAQERKNNRIESDWTFSISIFIFIVADHRFKLEQKIGTESSCANSKLVRSHAYFPE